jgi:predicted extracellular nuclease
MRLSVEAAVVAGPTTRHGEVAVVPDGGWTGAPAPVVAFCRQRRERAQPLLAAFIPPMPHRSSRVGDRFTAPLSGVLTTAGGYRLVVSEPPPVASGVLAGGATELGAEAGTLTLATLNVENLSAVSPAAKFEQLAALVVERLRSPALLALEEVQDDSGPDDDGTVSAEATLGRLVTAVAEAGGPTYSWHQVDPEDGRDGGQKGANIRVVLLVDPVRAQVVTRGAGTAVDATVVAPDGGLTLSPGRVAARHPAFTADPDHSLECTRKPLAVELEVDGRRLVVVLVHLISQRGDDPAQGDQLLGVSMPAGKVIQPGGESDGPFGHSLAGQLAHALQLGRRGLARFPTQRLQPDGMV